MDEKIKNLFDYIKNLCESDLNRIIHFVLGMTPVNEQLPDRPSCPYCGGSHVIKYGHKNGKQRLSLQRLPKNIYAYDQHPDSQFPL